jgi:hypothetical protein
MNANMRMSAAAYTLPLPDRIRNRFLATVLSEFNLNVLFSIDAVTPNIPALLISVTKLPSVVPVTVISKLSRRIVSPGVNVGFTV